MMINDVIDTKWWQNNQWWSMRFEWQSAIYICIPTVKISYLLHVIFLQARTHRISQKRSMGAQLSINDFFFCLRAAARMISWSYTKTDKSNIVKKTNSWEDPSKVKVSTMRKVFWCAACGTKVAGEALQSADGLSSFANELQKHSN